MNTRSFIIASMMLVMLLVPMLAPRPAHAGMTTDIAQNIQQVLNYVQQVKQKIELVQQKIKSVEAAIKKGIAGVNEAIGTMKEMANAVSDLGKFLPKLPGGLGDLLSNPFAGMDLVGQLTGMVDQLKGSVTGLLGSLTDFSSLGSGSYSSTGGLYQFNTGGGMAADRSQVGDEADMTVDEINEAVASKQAVKQASVVQAYSTALAALDVVKQFEESQDNLTSEANGAEDSRANLSVINGITLTWMKQLAQILTLHSGLLELKAVKELDTYTIQQGQANSGG